jgi:hypothetical protein
MEFPVKVNQTIEPHKSKKFDDIDITTQDMPKEEVLNISLVRKKTPEEIKKKKSD